ncbi:UNVERIFIED_ORG: hypothetical protein QOE_2079 [Clostridioides difficile F501]
MQKGRRGILGAVGLGSSHQASFPFGDLLRFAPRRRTHRAETPCGRFVRARTAERLGTAEPDGGLAG